MIEEIIDIIQTIIEAIVFFIPVVLLLFIILLFIKDGCSNNEVCLGGHYEIRNTLINGRLYPRNTFICDSSKIIYK